jgi:murein tripeptide amidase MpaA
MLTLSSKKAMEERKPVIFMIGRVHSGATPSSHMIQGVLDKLTVFDDLQTEKLLENYVFQIIPMINPDGVARGYWMRDALGLNLENHFEEPWNDVHPTIWAAKEAVLDCHS